MKNPQKKSLFRLNPLSKIILFTLSSSLSILASADNTSTKLANQPLFTIEAPKIWMPRVSITGEYGNYGVGQADLFTPFYSNNRSIVFFDLRATASANSTQEYNGALGFRSIVGEANKSIVGAHIWDDRKHTQYGNFFDQATLGGEYFGPIYSVTSNIYVPYGDKKQLAYGSSAGTTPFVTGHTVGYFSDAAYETALKGIDVEVGKQDLIDRHLRIYADYYHFGEGSDSVRMNGGRARSEFIIENKWLHQMGTDVMLTASVQYDNVEHAAGFLGVRLNVGRDYEPTDPLVGRLEEYIIRDNNIVAPIGIKSSIRVTDPDTFIFVDNTKPAGGDGTKEHPYNNEQEAITNAKSGNVIYTFQGAGDYALPNGGLNLIQNVVFFGAGSDYIFNHVVVIPATNAPTLNGRINVASNDTIDGFIISGQGTSENIGIAGNNVSNVYILNTTIQDFSGIDANGTAGGNGGTGGNAYGIQITNSDHLTLDHITVNNIIGGNANGSDTTGTDGGSGGTGGSAIGIDLSGSSLLISNVSIANITGGNANGGSASSSNGGNGGTAGIAYGINLANVNSLTISNVSINNLIGGNANGGDGTVTATTGSVNGGNGSVGGSAVAINLDNASSVTLSNITISDLSSGSANGGNANSDSTSTFATHGGNGGSSGSAVGINLTSSSLVTFSNISISHLVGNSSQGGDASTSFGVFVTGGNGGAGGSVIGINGINSLPSSVTVTDLTGGTASGGAASGGASDTPGSNGTNGTANQYQP